MGQQGEFSLQNQSSQFILTVKIIKSSEIKRELREYKYNRLFSIVFDYQMLCLIIKCSIRYPGSKNGTLINYLIQSSEHQTGGFGYLLPKSCCSCSSMADCR